MWFIGVEVEQETSAPPPEKNPGSAAPAPSLLFMAETWMCAGICDLIKITLPQAIGYRKKQHDSAKLIMFQENMENGDRVTESISVGKCTALQAQLHTLKKLNFRSAIKILCMYHKVDINRPLEKCESSNDARSVTQISVSSLTPESTSKLMMLLLLFEVLKYILQMPC